MYAIDQRQFQCTIPQHIISYPAYIVYIYYKHIVSTFMFGPKIIIGLYIYIFYSRDVMTLQLIVSRIRSGTFFGNVIVWSYYRRLRQKYMGCFAGRKCGQYGMECVVYTTWKRTAFTLNLYRYKCWLGCWLYYYYYYVYLPLEMLTLLRRRTCVICLNH